MSLPCHLNNDRFDECMNMSEIIMQISTGEYHPDVAVEVPLTILFFTKAIGQT